MGDSWEDEEFEIPTLNAAPADNSNKVVWDDEEVVVQPVQSLPAAPTAAQIEAARKKKEEEAEKAALKIQFAQQMNESTADKKLREKMQMEEADTELSAELFGGGVSRATSGVSGISISRVTSSGDPITLKNMKDHQNYAITVANKFIASDSTPFNIGGFYMKMTNELKGKLPVESLTEAIEALQNELENKKANMKKAVAPKKSKKQSELEKKKHADTFGGDDYDDKYTHYSNIEDDFM